MTDAQDGSDDRTKTDEASEAPRRSLVPVLLVIGLLAVGYTLREPILKQLRPEKPPRAPLDPDSVPVERLEANFRYMGPEDQQRVLMWEFGLTAMPTREEAARFENFKRRGRLNLTLEDLSTGVREQSAPVYLLAMHLARLTWKNKPSAIPAFLRTVTRRVSDLPELGPTIVEALLNLDASSLEDATRELEWIPAKNRDTILSRFVERSQDKELDWRIKALWKSGSVPLQEWILRMSSEGERRRQIETILDIALAIPMKANGRCTDALDALILDRLKARPAHYRYLIASMDLAMQKKRPARTRALFRLMVETGRSSPRTSAEYKTLLIDPLLDLPKLGRTPEGQRPTLEQALAVLDLQSAAGLVFLEDYADAKEERRQGLAEALGKLELKRPWIKEPFQGLKRKLELEETAKQAPKVALSAAAVKFRERLDSWAKTTQFEIVTDTLLDDQNENVPHSGVRLLGWRHGKGWRVAVQVGLVQSGRFLEESVTRSCEFTPFRSPSGDARYLTWSSATGWSAPRLFSPNVGTSSFLLEAWRNGARAIPDGDKVEKVKGEFRFGPPGGVHVLKFKDQRPSECVILGKGLKIIERVVSVSSETVSPGDLIQAPFGHGKIRSESKTALAKLKGHVGRLHDRPLRWTSRRRGQPAITYLKENAFAVLAAKPGSLVTNDSGAPFAEVIHDGQWLLQIYLEKPPLVSREPRVAAEIPEFHPVLQALVRDSFNEYWRIVAVEKTGNDELFKLENGHVTHSLQISPDSRSLVIHSPDDKGKIVEHRFELEFDPKIDPKVFDTTEVTLEEALKRPR